MEEVSLTTALDAYLSLMHLFVHGRSFNIYLGLLRNAGDSNCDLKDITYEHIRTLTMKNTNSEREQTFISEGMNYLANTDYVPKLLFGPSLQAATLRHIVAHDRYAIRSWSHALLSIPFNEAQLAQPHTYADDFIDAACRTPFFEEMLMILKLLTDSTAPLPSHTSFCRMLAPDDDDFGCLSCRAEKNT